MLQSCTRKQLTEYALAAAGSHIQLATDSLYMNDI
jgi:hypothetical protein